MFTDKLADYFLPSSMRKNKADPRYDEFHNLTNNFIAAPFMGLFAAFLYWQGKFLLAYYLFTWTAIALIILLSIKYFAHYRIPMGLLAIFAYGVTYSFVSDNGYIYSPSMTLVHLYLLAGIGTDKKWGWLFTISNLAFIVFIYYKSVQLGLPARYSQSLGAPGYVLGMHVAFTTACGILLGYQQYAQEKSRKQIRDMQDQQINVLDETVKNAQSN